MSFKLMSVTAVPAIIMTTKAFCGDFCYDIRRPPTCAASSLVNAAYCTDIPFQNPHDYRFGPRLQDTAVGGYADCASSPSGGGGPRSYYKILVPPGKVARFSAASVAPEMKVLLRALKHCDDSKAFYSIVGGSGPEQMTELCFRNTSEIDKQFIIAVSRYSGDDHCRQIVFRVSLQIKDDSPGCVSLPVDML